MTEADGTALPGTLRLIESVSAALAAMGPDLDPRHQATLFNVQIALAELALREDGAFLADHAAAGTALVDEGAALARSCGIADEAAGTTMARLEALVRALTPIEARDPRIALWLAEVVDWENRLYARRQQVGVPVRGATEQANRFTAEAIAAYLDARFPGRAPFRIEGLRRLAGGFSKTTVMFDAVDRTGTTEGLVIRAEQALSLIFLPGARVVNEFQVLSLAQDAGIPVAEPLWLETDTAPFGHPFLVSRRATGANLGSRVDVHGALSPELLRDFIRQLVRIHRTPVSVESEAVRSSHLAIGAGLATRRDAIRRQLDLWEKGIADSALPPSPLLARAFAWLQANLPESPGRPALLHGDYGLHNILVEDDRVACILDWEGSSVGDPADDLAWLLDGLGGRVDRAEIVRLYEAESGEQLSEERLRFFAVLNVVRFAVTCPTAIDLFENNPNCGVDACQLGLYFTYHGTAKLNRLLAEAVPARVAA